MNLCGIHRKKLIGCQGSSVIMSMADGYTAVQALSLIWINCLQNQHEGRLIYIHPHPQAPVI